ncbi:hypothetical protein LIER_13206 [Lithospermum erythrorhizon]|uniref:MLO-like protein n=1 Tax=Lithospermum erythrorhizon TaxID=34254 RepID=A0AAV3PWR9_LITER
MAEYEGGSGASRQLDQTPTWAVACVCAIIILISIALEKLLHRVGTWLTSRDKKALFEALEKLKTELMTLGFISLTLVFSQTYIARICISEKVASHMLPCTSASNRDPKLEEHNRKLLAYDRRSLSDIGHKTCKEGQVVLISVDGLHQIHILIFFLAVIHVLYSAITMALGRLKTRGWKEWEKDTKSHLYKFSNDPSRFRLTHETSFVKGHTSFWTRMPIFFYMGCFFRQFFRSVHKSDYLTLRNGFISDHLAPGSTFNFQKYIKRSLEDDFKKVVGVSPVLWASFVVYLLINISGWHALFWASLVPIVIILLVGTKLQAIMTRMAVEITERHDVVHGMPLIQGSDKYFWFGRPQLVLHLIHFALFQNAFQITYFLWIWYEYGIHSCFHDDGRLLIAKLALGVGVLVLCSYITLPLYALMAQMGSHMKKTIFDDQTSKAIKKWHMAVKDRREKEERSTNHTFVDASPTASSPGSPLRPTALALRRFKSTGDSTRSFQYKEHSTSDLEKDDHSPHEPLNPNLMIKVDQDGTETELIVQSSRDEEKDENEFSFTKPPRQGEDEIL